MFEECVRTRLSLARFNLITNNSSWLRLRNDSEMDSFTETIAYDNYYNALSSSSEFSWSLKKAPPVEEEEVLVAMDIIIKD